MAARIMVTSDQIAREVAPHRLLAVEVAEYGDAWLLRCNGDGERIHECPAGLEPGDTWLSLEPAVQMAVRHIAVHEVIFRGHGR